MVFLPQWHATTNNAYILDLISRGYRIELLQEMMNQGVISPPPPNYRKNDVAVSIHISS